MVRDREQRGLQLLPMMNLATLLIPVLFMVGQVVVVRAWHADQPVAEENPGDALVRPVALQVELSEAGLRILGAEEVLAGPEGRPLIPCHGSCRLHTYDYASLHRLLGHVKDAYPWVDEVEIVAPVDTPYPVVAELVRTARTEDGEDLFPRVRLATPTSE